jgi:hypothetical protein
VLGPLDLVLAADDVERLGVAHDVAAAHVSTDLAADGTLADLFRPSARPPSEGEYRSACRPTMNGTGVFDWAWARQRTLRHWGCDGANRTHLDSILDSLAVAGAAVVNPWRVGHDPVGLTLRGGRAWWVGLVESSVAATSQRTRVGCDDDLAHLPPPVVTIAVTAPPPSLFSHGPIPTQKSGLDRGNINSRHNPAILRLHNRPPDRPTDRTANQSNQSNPV